MYEKNYKYVIIHFIHTFGVCSMIRFHDHKLLVFTSSIFTATNQCEVPNNHHLIHLCAFCPFYFLKDLCLPKKQFNIPTSRNRLFGEDLLFTQKF